MTVSPANTTAVPAVGRPSDGVLDALAGPHLDPESREDEQGVIDADGQTQHRGEDDRVLTEGEERAVGENPDDAHAYAEYRDQEIEARCEERAEGEDQHEERDDHADGFTDPGSGGPDRHQVAAQLHPEIGRGVRSQIESRGVVRFLVCVRELAVAERRDGDARVLGDGRADRIERIGDRVDSGQSARVGEHRGDLRRHCGIGDRPVRLEHELQGRR